MSRIFILGAGAWGTALALSLHRRGGHQLTLWAHSPEFAQEILAAHENTQFLPGFPLPPSIAVTGDCAAVREAEIVVSVVPSEYPARGLGASPAASPPRPNRFERHQGHRGPQLSAHDPSHRRMPQGSRDEADPDTLIPASNSLTRNSPSAHSPAPASRLRLPRASPQPSRLPSRIAP